MSGFDPIDLEQVSNFDQLLTYFQHLSWPAETKERTLAILRTGNLDKITLILQKLGISSSEINRIFKYGSGRLKSSNGLRSEANKLYNYTKNYLLIDKLTPPGVYQSEDGVLVPAYKISQTVIYEPDSEYYLAGSQVLVIQNVYEGIQLLTHHAVDSDSFKILLKYTPPGTNFIFDQGSENIYPLEGYRVLKVSNPKQIQYIQAMKSLDQLIQPYPKGYLIDQPILFRLVESQKLVHPLNQILTFKWSAGDPEIYTRLGITDLCFTSHSNLALTLNTVPKTIFGSSRLL